MAKFRPMYTCQNCGRAYPKGNKKFHGLGKCKPTAQEIAELKERVRNAKLREQKPTEFQERLMRNVNATQTEPRIVPGGRPESNRRK